MNTQIQKVTYYIETHLDDELDLLQLAKVAGYSHFHFCRIFKVHTGESVLSYATRLRLERAAAQLHLDKKSMINVALDAGYQTPTGFLKAFKKRFDTTPTDYKVSQKIHRRQYKDIKMNAPEIIKREEAYVVFTRELGDYSKSSEIAWARLTKDMDSLDKVFEENPPNSPLNLGKDACEAIGICHDNPQVTDVDNIRYDAALGWGKKEVDVLSNYGFQSKTIAGGTYAKVSYMGSAEVAQESWYGLYAWIEENGYECRDEPAFEKYTNAIEEKDPLKFLNEIYVPIV